MSTIMLRVPVVVLTRKGFTMNAVCCRQHKVTEAHWHILGARLALWISRQADTAAGIASIVPGLECSA